MAAQQFHVDERSKRDQTFAVVVSLFFIAGIAILFWGRPEFRSAAGYVVGGCATLFFIWVLMREFKMASGRKNFPIMIDEKGVRYATPGEIDWSEIAGIEPVPARQRVDLSDAKGTVRISLRYDLEEADELFQFVADMLAERWPEKPLPQEFGHRMSWSMPILGVAAVAAIVRVILYRLHNQPNLEIVCFGILAMVVLGYLALWTSRVRRLAVTSDGLEITKGLQSRALGFKEIDTVTLAMSGSQTQRRLDVKLELDDGGSIYVLPRKCDPFDIYATVKAAWKHGRSSTASATAQTAAAPGVAAG